MSPANWTPKNKRPADMAFLIAFLVTALSIWAMLQYPFLFSDMLKELFGG